MKRSALFLFTVVLSIFFTYNVFAQDIENIEPTPGDFIAQNVDKNPDESGSPGIMGRGPMRGMGPMMGRMPKGPGAMGPMGLMAISPDLAGKIGLSEEQKGKIDDIITNHRKDMIKRDADISLAQIDLNKLMSQENPDMNLVKENIQKLANLRADKQFAQFKAMIDAKNVLTKEQQAKLQELKKEHQTQIKEATKERRDAGQRPLRPRMGGRPR